MTEVAVRSEVKYFIVVRYSLSVTELKESMHNFLVLLTGAEVTVLPPQSSRVLIL